MGVRVVSGCEGNRYNRLTAIRFVGMNRYHKSVWEFRCDCGGITEASLTEVKYGHIKSCGCLVSEHLEEIHGQNRLPEGESSFNGLYQHSKRGAIARGHAWNIDKECFRKLAESDCFYCGAPPTRQFRSNVSSNGTYGYNGIDRVDSARGYETDNVVPCCWICNRAKYTMSVDEFLAWVKQVFEHSIGSRDAKK